MSIPINANSALITLGLIVLIWCGALSFYAAWTTDRNLRLSLARLTEAFGTHLIDAGKRMRKNKTP